MYICKVSGIAKVVDLMPSGKLSWEGAVTMVTFDFMHIWKIPSEISDLIILDFDIHSSWEDFYIHKESSHHCSLPLISLLFT